MSLSAALALGGAGIATGAPEDDGGWDLGAYDDCIEKTIDDAFELTGGYDYDSIITACCLQSGGVATMSPSGVSDCVAPPADPQGRSPGGPGVPPSSKPSAPIPAVSTPPLAIG